VRILVIGGGGREHAIVLALSHDPQVTALACAPGNAGTAELAETHAVDVTDHLDAGIASLQAHEAYLRGLGRDFDPDEFVRGITAMAGPAISARHAVAFGQIHLQGV